MDHAYLITYMHKDKYRKHHLFAGDRHTLSIVESLVLTIYFFTYSINQLIRFDDVKPKYNYKYKVEQKYLSNVLTYKLR